MTPSVQSDSPREPTHLLVETPAGLCGLPLRDVVEVMRPLDLDPIPAGPAWLVGLGVVRGEVRVVVDLALLLGTRDEPRRWVRVRSGSREIVLAVSGVRGTASLGPAAVAGLDPLLRSVAADAAEALSRLDGDTVLLLEAARLVPESVLAELEGA